MAAGGLATAAVLVVFFARALEPWNGILQRIGVTLPLAALCTVAVWLLVQHEAKGRP
jgi:hypothetical protein